MIHAFSHVSELASQIGALRETLRAARADAPAGLCGFDGFIDSFIRMESPSSMAELGPKIAAAAGIAASYQVRRQGEKFGGNGPLLAGALHAIFSGSLDLTYVGALGRERVLPIFEQALGGKMTLHSLADPAHSDCLEFTDGKVMLCDLRSCDEITWERLLEVVGSDALDALLRRARFVGAVNWGKLRHAGTIWENLAARLASLGLPAKRVHFFMDLAEFETRPIADREALLRTIGKITAQCRTILSFNLKEAWQMAEVFGGDFHGRKDGASVAELAAYLRARIDADRIVIHPNDGAACASAEGAVYLPGPYCQKPLISTGAGDHFGAGCLAAALLGADDTGILLAGVATSGHFVRSGRSPSFAELDVLLARWSEGTLPERL